MKLFIQLGLVLIFGTMLNACANQAVLDPFAPTIKEGSVVSIFYKSVTDSGEVIGDNLNAKEPLVLVIGSDTSKLTAFEKKMIGLKKGAKAKFTIKAVDLFGHYDPKKVLVVARKELSQMKEAQQADQEIVLNERIKLVAQNEDGEDRMHFATVTKIEGDKVTLDLNPRFAGKDVKYDVRVINVEDASPAVLEDSKVEDLDPDGDTV